MDNYMVVNISVSSRRGRLRFIAYIWERDYGDEKLYPILKPKYTLYFLNYVQSLIGESIDFSKHSIQKTIRTSTGYRVVKTSGYRIAFYEDAKRLAMLYKLYLYSILRLRSRRKIEKLARCLASIDTLSPVIDHLYSIIYDIDRNERLKRIPYIIRAYCMVR